MRRHLEGTYSTLKFWGQPQHVANAGVLHSVYGAGGQFRYKILGSGSRDSLIPLSFTSRDASPRITDGGSTVAAARENTEDEDLPQHCYPKRDDYTLPDGIIFLHGETSNAENTARQLYYAEDLRPSAAIECHDELAEEEVPRQFRKLVSSLVGSAAERLIYLYSVIDFASVVEEVHSAGSRGFLESSSLYVKSWRGRNRDTTGRDFSRSTSTGRVDSSSGEKVNPYKRYYLLDKRDMVSLIIVAMADTMDQANDRCGWCEWLRPYSETLAVPQRAAGKRGDPIDLRDRSHDGIPDIKNDTNDRFWPGSSRPPIHLFPQARMGQILRKYGAFHRYEDVKLNQDENTFAMTSPTPLTESSSGIMPKDNAVAAQVQGKHFLPSVFGFCSLFTDLSEERERRARNLLWEVMQRTANDDDKAIAADAHGGSDSFVRGNDGSHNVAAAGVRDGDEKDIKVHRVEVSLRLPPQQTSGLRSDVDDVAASSASTSVKARHEQAGNKDPTSSGEGTIIEDEKESSFHPSQTQKQLLEIVELNPFLGEPWLLLAQSFFKHGYFLLAFFASSTALENMIFMGTAYLKTFSFATWLSAARVLRAKSRNLLSAAAGGEAQPRLDVAHATGTASALDKVADQFAADEEEFLFSRTEKTDGDDKELHRSQASRRKSIFGTTSPDAHTSQHEARSNEHIINLQTGFPEDADGLVDLSVFGF
ncbi:unnamed protein product [Amoebophrya sp. A25]|nr:unnamed protein product [Amoebophrya sp. A25]|eukprot:GSA25T00015802001.1